ncbi:hypothetical protein GCM10029976_042250 [Kribbella albertanoniae]|uniref:Fibronectin type-III domain-containing protein n=1 Tax=Kribbella albertanoniae TaxID=1266829 RepID=A0A4V2XSJ5_9ACTN|nr:fibronectin type III domain-containing protein [Kribbella albertanoniae]TDC34015.1 hypothetical protein E1261_04720 [Kribbella albertanoniae]
MSAPRSLLVAIITVTSLALTTGPAWAEPDTRPPTMPSDLKVSQLTATTVTFDWQPSTDDSGPVRYDVRVASGGWEAIALGTSQLFGGFDAGTSYQASVRAVDPAGNRSEPALIGFTTLSWSVPAPPTPGNLRAVISAGRLQSIAWDAVPDSGAVTYSLYSGSSFVAGAVGTQLTAAHLINNECVEPGSTHSLTVRAVGVDGQLSGQSAPLTVTFPLA